MVYPLLKSKITRKKKPRRGGALERSGHRCTRSGGNTAGIGTNSHTRGYIGDTTHLPVAVLKERLDGSCSFLRKGKCTIQAFKPTKSGESGRVWTLQEWIDEFHLEDYLDDVAAWNKLVVGLAMITKDIPEEKLDQSLAKVVMFGLYGDYDTSKPYQEEVQKNMVQLKAMLKDGFNLHVDFEKGAGV